MLAFSAAADPMNDNARLLELGFRHPRHSQGSVYRTARLSIGCNQIVAVTLICSFRGVTPSWAPGVQHCRSL